MGPFSRLQFVPPPVRHALSICCGSITISFFDLRAKYPIRRRDGAIDQFPFPSFLQSTPHSQNERALSPTHFSVVLTSLFTYHYLRVICYIEDICLHVTVSVSRCFHMTQAKLIVKDLLSKDSRCLTRQKNPIHVSFGRTNIPIPMKILWLTRLVFRILQSKCRKSKQQPSKTNSRE